MFSPFVLRRSLHHTIINGASGFVVVGGCNPLRIVFQHGRGFLLFSFGFQTETNQAFNFCLLCFAFKRCEDVCIGVVVEFHVDSRAVLCNPTFLSRIFLLGFYCFSPPEML